MSRDDGTNLTTFQWDNWGILRETTGLSTTTYCNPEGELLSFIRDGDRYDVHLDPLLSVRMVTDDNGDVVLRREFDGWGVELASSFDNVPGGFDFGFVGGYGCRKDASTGLIYMRARHYDPTLQRFISRDPLRNTAGRHLYSYVSNNPLSKIDPSGKSPIRIRFKQIGRKRMEEILKQLECVGHFKITKITWYNETVMIEDISGGGDTGLGKSWHNMLDFRRPLGNPFDIEFVGPTDDVLLGRLSMNRTRNREFQQDIDISDFDRLQASNAPQEILDGLMAHEFSEAFGSQSNPIYISEGLNSAYRTAHANEGYPGENAQIGPAGWQRTSRPNGEYPRYTADGTNPAYPAGSVWGFDGDLRWRQF